MRIFLLLIFSCFTFVKIQAQQSSYTFISRDNGYFCDYGRISIPRLRDPKSTNKTSYSFINETQRLYQDLNTFADSG